MCERYPFFGDVSDYLGGWEWQVSIRIVKICNFYCSSVRLMCTVVPANVLSKSCGGVELTRRICVLQRKTYVSSK